MGLFGSKTSILSKINHRQHDFESLQQYSFWKPCLGVQSHPEEWDDFEQGSTVNISECNVQSATGEYMYV